MSGDLLQTKLYVPKRPRVANGASLVPRPHLIKKLNAGLDGKLTLVSAPAGFGKTTLITEWIEQGQTAVCWLSLDEDDSDPHRFFNYLAATIRPLPNVQASLPPLLQSPQPLPAKNLMAAFVNDVTAVSTSFHLILDDYHAIDSPEIDGVLAFLLDHMPPHMTLVITSRTDPGFPISRLRARGHLTELRADNLRFTKAEAAQFLQQSMGLMLSPDQIATLESRTEGWIAGLQMAALSMQNRADVDGFIASFTGSHRFIMDYLVEEVLNQQPQEVQDFLMETAVLTHLCDSLCNAVMAQQDSQQILEQLEAANLFILPLDNQRRWYRYHPLFGDLLRDRLTQTYPEKITDLHHRASRWFSANSFAAEAIHHALMAKDETAAAQLIVNYAQEMIWRGDIVTLIGWIQALSPTAMDVHPRLGMSLALARLLAGKFASLDELLALLGKVETSLQTAKNNKHQFELNGLRAVLLAEQGQTDAGLAMAESVITELSKDVSRYGRYLTSMVTATMGLAYRDQGKTETAVYTYATISKSEDNLMSRLHAAYEQSKLHQEMGQLHQAEKVHRQAIAWAEKQVGTTVAALPLSGAAHIGLGSILYEWHRLDEARNHLEMGIERAQQKGGLGLDRDGLLTLSLVYQAQGRVADANELMAQAETHARRSPRSDAMLRLRPFQVQLWLAQDYLAQAGQWADQQQFDSKQRYPTEVTAVSVASVYIAQKQPERALSILNRTLPIAEGNGRWGRVIQILALQTVAHNQRGQAEQALVTLERCLALAKPEGYTRLFLELGQSMAKILYTAVQQKISPQYAGKLLTLFANEQKSVTPPAATTLIEPLTTRELDVLQLVATGLTNREVGLRLHLSPNTIKRHTLNIYEKLSVHSRTEAVTIARNLGILA